MADRIAQPPPDVRWRVLCVQAYDPRVMHHLHKDHDVFVGLHDSLQVVVQDGQHRRAAGGAETEQAALGERPELGVIVRAGIQALLHPPSHALVRTGVLGARLAPGLGLWSPRRLAPVLGIRNDRRAPLPVDLEAARSAVDPERVVSPHVASRTARSVTAVRGRFAIRIRGRVASSEIVGLVPSDLRGLLVGQRELVAVLGWALQGRQRGDVVGSGEIRAAVRPAGDIGGLRDGDGDHESA